MTKETKIKNSGKLTLSGSLSALTKSVQKEQEKLNSGQECSDSKKGSSGTVISSIQWDSVISLAKDFKSNPRTKLETIYIYGNIKKDLELLKTIEELRNIPMTALVSSIIDNFITDNLVIIKNSLKNNENRF